MFTRSLNPVEKKVSNRVKIILFSILISVFIFFSNYSLFLEQEVLASPAEEQAALEKELKELEKRIIQYEQDITKT